jgi:anti-sigma B factor antagonist
MDMITNPQSADGPRSFQEQGKDTAGKPMHIEVVSAEGITVVRPAAERLDIEVAADFRAMLLSLIEQGQRRLVVDLAEVSFIDSSGLGALVSALKTLKRSDNGGDVRLTRVQPPVVSLLEIIRLNRVFTTYPTVEQAVQSFHQF